MQMKTSLFITHAYLVTFFFLLEWFLALVMASSGYVGEIQPAAQPQGAGVSVTPGQPDASSTPATTPQFLAEIQTTVATPTVVTPTGQTTPTEQATTITTQKPAAGSQAQPTAQAQPAQTQYVTAEIQGSPTQSGNAQSTPQYIVVTVTGKGWTSHICF